MDKIAEDLAYILTNFKEGIFDYEQTILKINAVYAYAIGAIPLERGIEQAVRISAQRKRRSGGNKKARF